MSRIGGISACSSSVLLRCWRHLDTDRCPGRLTATILVGDLEDWLHIKLPPSLVWDYPSIEACLLQQVAGKQEFEAALSASNDKAVSGTADGTDTRHLLENLDRLSDAEVDALLTQLASSELASSKQTAGAG